MSKTVKARYSYILNLLQYFKPTFEQIKARLLQSEDFRSNGITTYSLRTFQRDIHEIKVIYKVDIESKDGKYIISNRDDTRICSCCNGKGYNNINSKF